MSHAQMVAKWRGLGPEGISAWLEESSLSHFSGDFDGLSIYHTGQGFENFATSDRRVAVLLSHGNGIDSAVGNSALCGLLDVESRADLVRYLPCAFGGPCVRQLRSDPSFIRMSVRTIPGDILIWGTCNGWLLKDSQFDARGGLLRALWDPERPRQVLTTYRLATLDEAALVAAAICVNSGWSLGSVTRLLNSAYVAMNYPDATPPWVLLGDPTTRFEGNLSAFDRNFSSARSGILHTADDDLQRTAKIHGVAPADDGARFWVAPVPGSPLTVWVHDAVGASMASLKVISSRDDAAHVTLRRIWSSGPSLAFAHNFFLRSKSLHADKGFDYPDRLINSVRSTVDRFKACNSLLSLSPLHGIERSISEIAQSEQDAWISLNGQLHGTLVQFILTAGCRLNRTIAAHAVRSSEVSRSRCKYCGRSMTITRINAADICCDRVMIECDGCSLVSDADSKLGSIELRGPARGIIGGTLQFEVILGERSSADFESGFVSVAFDPGFCLGSANGDQIGKEKMPLDSRPQQVGLEVPWDFSPGVYYVVGIFTVDGCIAVARRPILLTDSR